MSGVSGSGGFDYGQIANTMGQSSSTAGAQLSSFSNTMDPSSSADLIKLQNLTQQWTMALNLQSNMLKLVGDVLKGIVQKAGVPPLPGGNGRVGNPVNFIGGPTSADAQSKSQVLALGNLVAALTKQGLI